jgi:hypothetical protein
MVPIRVRSGSVVAAALFHGCINVTSVVSFMMLKGGTDLTTGILGLPGFAVLLAANVLLVVYDRLLEKDPLTMTG